MEQNVYGDCWQLLQHFGRAADALNEAKFELFCQTWHELQMQHIYSAQTNHIEVIETTMAALHVGKRVACGRRTSGEPFLATRAQRIGAIYLLYAIYNKQPTKLFVKIEVSPRTWESLTGYLEHLRSECTDRSDTQQVSYIFWQLVKQQAFRYTALDYCQALDSLAAYDSLESFAEAKQKTNNRAALLKQQLNSSVSTLSDELHELAEMSANCQTLCELETAYNKQMEPHRHSFPATNIFSHLRDVFCQINDLLTDEQRPTTSRSPNEQLDLRKRARLKAMYGETKEQAPTEEIDEKALPEPHDHHERRMSSATVFSRRLPDDVIRDLECEKH
ncbi:snRNA-activating protein complex subunit 1 [Drosophila mojavensis]|uniref:snRNA-activating protein complex subunit 1 n=1 Tax=Drosophila mojavensis TaxID=7230 RepID=B4K5R3_DROMO|nr:snRNA-activating protein complex subunit 1 [Drosophila mojavensis]EDW15125.1 uncharacterized protein Dmoj_GI24646 [Drosophila mojavensis]